jgi:hypothetical protein
MNYIIIKNKLNKLNKLNRLNTIKLFTYYYIQLI